MKKDIFEEMIKDIRYQSMKRVIIVTNSITGQQYISVKLDDIVVNDTFVKLRYPKDINNSQNNIFSEVSIPYENILMIGQ